LLLGDLIYSRLKSKYELNLEDFVAPRLRGMSLFEFIVAVILSQNTSDKNAWRAYSNLKSRLKEITPKRVLEINPGELTELIRPAGMHYTRSRKILELARVFAERNVESLIEENIERGDIEELRHLLLKLPGIGFKTADVVLLMYFNQPVFPVDTHITRITNRLGFVKRRNYEEISSFWARNTSPDKYLELHLLLIEHGRETCKARKTLCIECVIKDLCEYYKAGLK
jgi:endonuclease-3